MFELTKEEFENLMSKKSKSSWGGRRKAPYAFTEQGVYMLATVLRGEIAEQQSIFIMRAFREMRHYIRQNQQFVTTSEMKFVTAKVSEMSVQVAGIVDWKNKAEHNMKNIQKSVDILNDNFISDKDFNNQYAPLRIKSNSVCHDRLNVLDYGLQTEQVYHCGASSKDAGKKAMFMDIMMT